MSSVSIVFIFEQCFPGVFKYNEKYDELLFNVNEVDVNKFPSNLRNIWYKYFPQLINKYHKLAKVYDETKLMSDIEHDELLEFIPEKLINRDDLKDRVFHKLLENDYNFLKLTDRSDRKHHKFYYCVQYDTPQLKGWNVNEYLKSGLLKVKDLKPFMLPHVGHEYVIQWTNRFKSTEAWELFTNTEHDKLLNFEGLTPEMTTLISNSIISSLSIKRQLEGIHDKNLLNTCSIKYYECFDLDEFSIQVFIFNSIIDKFNSSNDKLKSEVNAVVPKICQKLANSTIYNQLLHNYTMEPFVSYWSQYHASLITLIQHNIEATDMILELFPQVVSNWFHSAITTKLINSQNFTEYWNKYNERFTDRQRWINDCCLDWIKTYHEEPPLQIYISPNTSNGQGTTYNYWNQYVNPATTPNEMKSLAYWQYMVSTKGKKRNPNDTVMYSFFSNTDENKIIFCKSDVELREPAKGRYSISVPFSLLKPFLHEELETNDICRFTHLTKNDWNKIAGGNDNIDVVVFNEMKNYYGDRTPLKQVLDYLVEQIEIKFDVECEVMN